MKIVRTTVKERIVEGKYKYKRIYISTDLPIDVEPGNEVELVIMTREEWMQYQEKLESLRKELENCQHKELENCQQLVISEFEMCHRVVQLVVHRLQRTEEKKTGLPTAVEPSPQPQVATIEIPQPRRRRSRRQRQAEQQAGQRPQMELLPAPADLRERSEPLTVPADLRERLLQNQWVKILRERQ